MEDFFERTFSDANQAETFAMILVLGCVAFAIWFGRKKLRVVIPLAVIAVLFAAITIPSCVPARWVAHQNACRNNLRMIKRAKAKWAEAQNRQPSDMPTMADLFGPGLEFKNEPICPSGGTYSLGAVGEEPRCSWAARGHNLE